MEKTKLLDLLATQDKPYTVEEWMNKLNLQSTQEIEDFMRVVRECESEFEITYTKKNKLVLVDQSEFVRGILSINPKGFGFVDHPKGSLYIANHQFNGAMHEDEVLVKPKVYADLSAEGVIIRVIKHNTKQLVGTWKKNRIQIDDVRVYQKIELIDSDMSHCVFGSQLLLDIVSYGDPLKVKLNKVLGHVNDPGMDILTLLHNHQVPMTFSDELMKEVDALPTKVILDPSDKRVDYRDRQVITIDGEDAKDFDDAISIKKLEDGYQLDVHIADVSYYVREHTELDKEARKRGTSVYVIDRVVPMLPHAISNGLCSLVEGEDRLTLTCSMKINQIGEIETYDIHPSIIRSYKRMTYTNVNRMIKKDKSALNRFEDLVPMVEDMRTCAKIIRQRRRNDGSIDFVSFESKFTLNAKGEITKIEGRTQGEAEMIIEDFMICANQAVAAHLRWLEIPALYRVHEAPDKKRFAEFSRIALFWGVKVKHEHLTPKVIQKLISRFEGKDEFLIVNDLLLRSMSKAKYDKECSGHFGLALEDYCHFTSPIRRYPDLIVHRMLRKHVFTQHHNELVKDELLVEQLGFECSNSEQRAVESERDVEAMKKAEYMTNHIGERFDGIISSVNKFGFFVRLPNTVEGLVHVSNLPGYFEFDADRYTLVKRGSNVKYKLGQKVRVKLKSADKIKQTIDFVID
jgi:ribonuclease R